MGDVLYGIGDIGAEVAELTEAARAQPEHERLPFMKGWLARMGNSSLRQAVEDIYLTFRPDGERRHVVVLLHGIRTEATWQEPLAAALETVPGVVTRPLRYGAFSVFGFWFPFFFRTWQIHHVQRQLRTIISEEKGARLSIIAHSFGTFVISHILFDQPDIRLYRLILCGSIVPRRFRWDRVSDQIRCSPIVNECGVRDPLPILARVSTIGFGASGTYGFEQSTPLNRFHNLRHSDFLKEEFYKAHWVPLFREPLVAPPRLAESPRPVSPRWYGLISLLPLLVFATVLVGWLMVRA